MKKEYVLCVAVKRLTPRFASDIMYHNNVINNIGISYCY